MKSIVEQADQAIRDWIGGCSCHEAYAGYDRYDPQCHWHQAGEDLAQHLADAGLLKDEESDVQAVE